MSADPGDLPLGQSCEAALLDTLLDVSGLLVVVLDAEGNIRRFNRACEQLTGYEEGEVLGRSIWSTLIPEDELPNVQQVHGRLRQNEEASNTYVNHWMTREGERRLIQWRNATLRDERGVATAFVGTGIDVTEQERALKARLRWEHERHYLLDALPVLIAHVGADFRIRFANDGYRQWFGLEPQQVQGEHVRSIIGETAFETLEPCFREALAGRRSVYHGEVVYLHGPSRFIHGTYIPAFDENSKVDGFYIVSVDLTEPQRLRQERDRARQEAQSHLLELAHATRLAAMSEVATGLAHEISQPLTAIAATAEACLMGLDADPPRIDSLRSSLEKVAAQGQRARKIIEQLRSFLRKEEEDAREDCDPRKLVQDVLLLLESELAAAGVEVEADIEESIRFVHVNRIQIEQVLFNLVRNAVDALREHGGERRVRIRCRPMQDKPACLVEVADSGPGISEVDRSRLFHPFYTTKRQGLGQGLSICRSILDRHGAAIEAENGPRGGAVFRFTLPLGGRAGE